MNWVTIPIGGAVGGLISAGGTAFGIWGERRRRRLDAIASLAVGDLAAMLFATQRAYDYAVRDLGKSEADRIYGSRPTRESVLREHLADRQAARRRGER